MSYIRPAAPPESISEMREFFKNNDFTEGILPEHEAEIPVSEANLFPGKAGEVFLFFTKLR